MSGGNIWKPQGPKTRNAGAAGWTIGLLAAGIVLGCRPGGDPPLLVFTASGLEAAFSELVPRFETTSGIPVEVMIGSSGALQQQVRNGAPADLFFAANVGFLDALIQEGRIEAGSRRLYATGRIVVAVAAGGAGSLDTPGRAGVADASGGSRENAPTLSELADPRFRVIVIANPNHAPYGVAAMEALDAVGIRDQVEDRIVLASNVVHAYQILASGNADAGVLALSLVRGAPDRELPHRLIPDSLHAPLLHAAGVVAGTTQPERAHAFLEFVLSDAGQAILARFGFEASPLPAVRRGS